jgi:hypothetical protein
LPGNVFYIQLCYSSLDWELCHSDTWVSDLLTGLVDTELLNTLQELSMYAGISIITTITMAITSYLKLGTCEVIRKWPHIFSSSLLNAAVWRIFFWSLLLQGHTVTVAMFVSSASCVHVLCIVIITSLMTPQSWREWNIFGLQSSTVYRSIIFANCKCKFDKISLRSKSNVKTSSRRLKPDSCQTHQNKTDRLTPDSHRPHSRRHHQK